MRSSIFPLIYSIFLFKSSFISSASFSNEGKNQHDIDKAIDELENSYYENEAILALLGFSMNFDINSIPMNRSVETRTTPPPVTHQILDKSTVTVTDPRPKLKPSRKNSSKNVEIKNTEIRERLIKLFQAQVPRADYDLNNFGIEGWPESVDRLRRRWNLPEIELIDQNFINFKFIPIPSITNEMLNFILMDQSVETSITQPLFNHQILEESGVTVTNPSPALKPSRKSSSKNVEIKNTEIRERLFKLFQAQVPRADYDLRNFEIEGWPESVDRLRRRWNLPEIDLIDRNFINFKFIPIPRITYEKQHGFDISGVNFAYDENLSSKDVIEKLRNRYRIESRHTDADRIEWKQLDRSKIPKKYDSVPINGPAMKIAQIRRCPEIVDNIHFHPLSDYELFCKSFGKGTQYCLTISKYKKIQFAQGILPDPKYEMEAVNGSIVRTFDGVPVLADQNSSSDTQADESPQPDFTNEEFEELLSEIMMPETDSTIHNIRKRTFDLIEPQNHVNFFMD